MWTCRTGLGDRVAWHRTSSTERGYGVEWRRLRKQAIQRDFGLWVMGSAARRVSPFFAVDHIKPKAQGGTDTLDLDNVQCLCRACHAWKTAGEANGIQRRATGADGWPI